MATVNDHLVGEVLDGRFEIIERIDGGGMGTVYKAKDRHVDRVVAIKVMRDDVDNPIEYARRFDAEARAVAKLSDSHIVSVFDQGTDRDRPYIVMEFVEGTNLKAVIVSQGPMPTDRVLPLLEAIVGGLAAAHTAGIIHRDIKPENVLISQRGEVKVTDFGLASQSEVPTMTYGGGVLASISYASPERLLHKAPVDFRSDIYSVAIVAFEMLTGRKPFGGDIDALITHHLQDNVPAPSTVIGKAAIPAWLDELVAACGRRATAERPIDARELLRRLRLGMEARRQGVEDDPALIAAMTATAATTASPRVVPTTPPSKEPTATVLPRVTRENTPRLTQTPASRVPHAVPPPPTFHGRRVFVVILTIIAIIAVCLGGWWLMSGRYTTIPDIKNQTTTDAGNMITSANLTLTTDQAYSEDVAAGLVISSDPPAGAKVLRGSTVHAVVSQGPQRFGVPKLVGLPLADAQAALTTANLTTGTVTQSYSDDAPSGQVISASANEGDQVKAGTAVDLVVSKGPTPIPVPDFTGKPAVDAADTLASLGLKLSQTMDTSPTVDEGFVISQDPPAGTTLFKGDTVTLTVSQGPPMVTVPPGLVGANADDAKAALEALGLKAVYIFSPTVAPPMRQNIVAYTSPASGTSVKEGSSVTLYIR